MWGETTLHLRAVDGRHELCSRLRKKLGFGIEELKTNIVPDNPVCPFLVRIKL